MYDLLVKNGLVYDGTGSPPYNADVAVVDGEIIAIGRLEGEAAKTIDAKGLAVSPGFIDLHTRSDMSFLLDSTAQSKETESSEAISEITANLKASASAEAAVHLQFASASAGLESQAEQPQMEGVTKPAQMVAKALGYTCVRTSGTPGCRDSLTRTTCWWTPNPRTSTRPGQ